VGTNRRYAESLDRRVEQREAERAMREHEPSSLHRVELDLEHEPLTRAPDPVAVEAWVRYGPTAVNVRGVATAWTARAVAVKWPTPDGGEHRAWVWASAVRRR
jgi:hypothetical protein